MLPTVRSVLELPELQCGRPVVRSGADELDRPIRWVHVLELADVVGHLRGGELVLTTGIALPDSPAELTRYVAALASVGVAGLVVELGRRYTELPVSLLDEARRHALPVVALHRQVAFVAITEAVHSLILDAQFEQLRSSEAAHRVFTELSLDGAPVEEILRQASTMVSAPVVLENLSHRVLVAEGAGESSEVLLRDWEGRSRRVRTARATTVDPAAGWAVTPVGARGETWGRLVMVSASEITDHQILTLERAAAAIALNRLAQRDLDSLDRHAHGRLIADILRPGHGQAPDLAARLEAVGLPTRGRAFTGVVVRDGTREVLRDVGQQRRDLERAEQVNAAVAAVGVSALVAVLGAGQIAVLLSLPAGADRGAVLAALAQRLHAELTRHGSARAIIGVGSPIDRLDDLRLTLIEARQVAEAAQSLEPAPYFELPDIHLDGLLLLLRDDPRLQAFVERELGALLRHDEEHGSDLLAVLRAYLDHGRNKTSAANAYHASRLTFYRRLDAIEQVLGVDLDSVPRCMSLHVALVALDNVRGDSA